MTKFEILKQINKEFPNAEKEKILILISDLEHRLYREVFSVIGKKEPKNVDSNLNHTPLSADTNATLYISYISYFLSVDEEDFARANAFCEMFNQIYSELAISTRRTNKPITNHILTGGDLF